ncbi:N-acetylmuramoyl-L-alanine amidase [Stenotrophomonas sp.]|uniref:N-acetylmuramoyl-L-alanine amidase n=1 Tax=Stenotrophomonas sp. TaxID=69392 RepID=UPI002FC75D1F
MSSRPLSSLMLMVVSAGMAVAALVAGTPARATPDGPLRLERDVELDTRLTQRARYSLERMPLVDGQSRPRHVSASMDIAKGVITVRLDRSFLPADYGPAFEDQRSIINNGLIHEAEQFAPVNAVKYLYDGKDVDHYFPEIKAADDAAREAGERRRQGGGGAGMAFVAAGHGYFLSHRTNAWVTTRDEHHGVNEGLLTPLYAAELKGLVEARSHMPVVRPRVQDAGPIHEDSGFEWWTMAARYAIARQYPGETSIWNTYAGSTLWDREEREDINSRPMLANHLNADVAIHLHSNADDNGTARGARVITQPGRAVDHALGRSVLCSMKEAIQSQPGYESFVVAPAPHEENKGENREAKMPSIIVETAFHTHPDDARALLDPVFRTAAMKGVEKGYRLWAAGKACEPLVGERIARVSLPSGGAEDVEVAFKGNPEYPLRLVTVSAHCPPGWTCTEGTRTIASPDQPHAIRLSCGAEAVGTLTWNTHIVDADGVASAPVLHLVNCG